MANYRLDRVNEEIVREMASILREIKDPRVSGYLTTVSGCEISPDFKYAKMYFSFLDTVSDPQEAEQIRKTIKKGLISAHGFIRRELARRLNLRVTPELTFIADTSAEYGGRINSILSQIKAKEEKESD